MSDTVKLIVEIPKSAYKMCQELRTNNDDGIIGLCAVNSIANAIPIGETNGDSIIGLYPDLKYTIQNGRVVTTIGVASSFDLEWWNAPYQKGGE